jgi:hypothetical protein
VTGRRRSAALLLLALAGAGPALGQAPAKQGVLTWEALGQAGIVKKGDRFVPQYPKEVAALDSQQVKLQGFMMPLEVGDKQSHFVLTAMPQTCSFCMPGGPESMVEVKSKAPIKYTFEPVVLSGTLAILKDDPRGVFYQLNDAVPAK